MGGIKDFAPYIVPFNENALFRISVNNLSKDVNDSISRACLDVAKSGSTYSCEFLILVNIVTGNWDYHEKGSTNSIGGEAFWEFVTNAQDKYVFIHNHSSGKMFSFEDLQTFLSTDSIEVMIASGHNGIVYCVQGKKRRIKNGLLDLDLMIECEHLLAPHKRALKEKTLEDLDYLRIRSDIYYKYVYLNYIEDFTEVQT
jgi:hypothetical protein